MEAVPMFSRDPWYSTLQFHWELVDRTARSAAIRGLTAAGRRADPERCLEEICNALAHLQVGRPHAIRLILNDHYAASSAGSPATPQRMAKRLLTILNELQST